MLDENETARANAFLREIELGEDYLLGRISCKQITAFGQVFDLFCEMTDQAVIALAITPQPA